MTATATPKHACRQSVPSPPTPPPEGEGRLEVAGATFALCHRFVGPGPPYGRPHDCTL